MSSRTEEHAIKWQTYLDATQTALQKVRNIPYTIRYERKVYPDTGNAVINDLRNLQVAVQNLENTAQMFARNDYVANVRTVTSLSHLSTIIDDALLYLVAAGKVGLVQTVQALQVRQQALQRINQVVHKTQEILEELM